MIGALKIHARMHYVQACRAWRRRRNTRHLANGPKTWVVTINSPRNGLFAHLVWGLTFLRYAQAHGAQLHLRATSAHYGAPDASLDWFSAFHSPTTSLDPTQPAVAITLREFEEWPEFWKYHGAYSPAEASACWSTAFPLHPAFALEVDSFCAHHWGTRPVVGVHYRGTDKHLEAAPLRPAQVIEHLRAVTSAWPELTDIFLATDESDFPTLLRTALPHCRIHCAEDALRSGDGVGVHHLAGQDGLRRAREALFDCVALAHCDLLLKTASMLSGWSQVLAPALPVVLLNPPARDRNFFPDCAIPGRLADLPDLLARARARAAARA